MPGVGPQACCLPGAGDACSAAAVPSDTAKNPASSRNTDKDAAEEQTTADAESMPAWFAEFMIADQIHTQTPQVILTRINKTAEATLRLFDNMP